MIINSLNNTIPRASKLESNECCLKVNGKDFGSSSALIKSKREISVKTNKNIKQHELTCSRDNFVSYPPRDKVSVEFAAKQFFQILLINIKYNHSKLESDLDLLPVPSESNPLIINI